MSDEICIVDDSSKYSRTFLRSDTDSIVRIVKLVYLRCESTYLEERKFYSRGFESCVSVSHVLCEKAQENLPIARALNFG